MSKTTSWNIAQGWHIANGSRGEMLRRDADFERYGQSAQLWEPFDVTRQPTLTWGNSYAYGDSAVVTASTNELVCYIREVEGAKVRKFRYQLPDGRVSTRAYTSWPKAMMAAWEVMHAADPNIGLPIPARVHGLAFDSK